MIRTSIIGGVLALVLGAAGTRADNPADDLLQKSREAYAALQSYADAGTILEEYGVSSTDRHTFATLFNRAPRRFLFEFNKQGGDRFVIWGDPDAFHTWWKTTGVTEDYPNPNNVGAFSLSGTQTYGAPMKVVPLLFAKAAFQGDFSNFAAGTIEGTEDLGGHRCHRLTGTASDQYTATGRQVNVRKMTIWIDVESFLIRKILEERKAPPGQINRRTTTFEPQANPTLGEARFRFTPPPSKTA